MARIKTRYRTVGGKKQIYGYTAVFYDPDRRPQEKSVTLRTSDKAAARRRLVELEQRYSMGTFDPWKDRAPEDGLTVETAAERYTASREGRRAASTVRADGSALKAFAEALPLGLPVAAVEARHVDRYINNARQRGLVENTLTTYYTRLNRFFRWCRDEALIRDNPVAAVERPKPETRVKVPLTRDQFDRLVQAVTAAVADHGVHMRAADDRWLVDVLHVGVGTGLRRGELCAMRWAWVDLEAREITVRRSHDFKPKSKHERTVPVRGEALEALRRLFREQDDADAETFVFRSPLARDGQNMPIDKDHVSKTFRKYRAQVGLSERTSLHCLRGR